MPRAALSTKGQIVIPKAVRDHHRWRAGTTIEFVVQPDGVFMKAAEPAAPKKYGIDDLVGFLKYDGPPVSIENMNEAVDEMFRKEWK